MFSVLIFCLGMVTREQLQGLLSCCMYVEQTTENHRPATHLCSENVKSWAQRQTVTVILQLLVKITLYVPHLAANISIKQLKGDLLAGSVISLSVLLESWTDLSG